MSRSVMDLKEVCLELCAGGILIKAMELVKLPNYQSVDPVEFLYECFVSEAARRLSSVEQRKPQNALYLSHLDQKN